MTAREARVAHAVLAGEVVYDPARNVAYWPAGPADRSVQSMRGVGRLAVVGGTRLQVTKAGRVALAAYETKHGPVLGGAR
jgi:hypothetical protein